MKVPDKQNYFYLFAVLNIAWCICWLIEKDYGIFTTGSVIVLFFFGILVNGWTAWERYKSAMRSYLERNNNNGK